MVNNEALLHVSISHYRLDEAKEADNEGKQDEEVGELPPAVLDVPIGRGQGELRVPEPVASHHHPEDRQLVQQLKVTTRPTVLHCQAPLSIQGI